MLRVELLELSADDVVAADSPEPSGKKHLESNFQGLPIVIEYEAGDVKEDRYGNKHFMQFDYGFIPDTISNEPTEALDVMVGPNPDSKRVFLAPLMQTKDPASLEEYKVLVGFSTDDEAERAIGKQYYCEIGDLMEMSMDDLRDWVAQQKIVADRDTITDDQQLSDLAGREDGRDTDLGTEEGMDSGVPIVETEMAELFETD